MTAPSTFEKTKAEKYTIAVEWLGQLPFSATLSSCTVAARRMEDQSDATSDVLVSPTATISGTQSRVTVYGGRAGQKYRLLFTAILSNAEIVEEAVYMLVREY